MSAILGQAVELGQINKELKKLWEADEAATNASLMNLAIYSEREGSLEENSEAIVELTREHACRALLVELNTLAEKTSVESWVTAQCHLAHGRKTVCCEQLAFRLNGRVVGRMRNTLFSNLSSDLPLVFWWQGPLSERFDERFYRLLDRFIFDSSDWSNVEADFPRVAAAVEDSRCKMVVQDLAWTRTFHYRLAIAGLFDDPVAQAMLGDLDTVSIVGNAGNWTSSWFLVAWLAVQAQWVLKEKTASGFVFETLEGVKVLVNLDLREEGPSISSVKLSGGEVAVEVVRSSDLQHLELALLSPNHEVRQVAPADPEPQVSLVAEQLSRGGKNSLFRKTWPMFFAMLAKG